MRFSIIVATINRTEENLRLLKSIAAQQYDDLEVIFADQNDDDRLNPILECFRSLFPIVHLRSQKGLSRARNKALALAQGEIICFPDDDCWYPHNLLIEMDRRFRENPSIAGFTGRCTDERGRLAAGGESKRAGLLNRHNVWRSGVSATMFLRSNVLKEVSGFDEELGVGAGTLFQSGEETELLLHAIKKGFKIQYLPSLVVYHPLPPPYSRAAVTRAQLYGAGMGRVLRKHDESPIWSYYYMLFPLGGALVALLQGDWRLAQIRVARACGRLQGWRADAPRSQERLAICSCQLPLNTVPADTGIEEGMLTRCVRGV
ncbi:MAG TPA: glycosyltransferase [Methylocella sp.]|nr:glycosyltransferase [Methylocella sp.]